MGTVCNDHGTVLEVLAEDRVRVRVERGEACGACAARGACGTFGGPKKQLEMVLNNPIGAQKGDTVSIVITESALIGASAVLYMIPAAALVLGAVIGHLFTGDQGDSDLSAATGAGIGLLTGFAITFVTGRFVSRKSGMIPALASIVETAAQDTSSTGADLP